MAFRVSFIMAPHAQNLDDLFFLEDLIHQAVLNIDAPQVCAGKVAYQLFVRGGLLKGS